MRYLIFDIECCDGKHIFRITMFYVVDSRVRHSRKQVSAWDLLTRPKELCSSR